MVFMMAPKKMKCRRGGERNKKLVRVKWRGVCVIWGGARLSRPETYELKETEVAPPYHQAVYQKPISG
jgi:hypothetical protein